MTPGWWRRNALALAAAAVLLPATAIVIGGSQWWAHYGEEPVFAHSVAAGAEERFAGAVWGPAKATTRPAGGEEDLPADARVVEVRVPVAPGERAVACIPPVLRELQGAQRQWDVAWAMAGTAYHPDEFTSCAAERVDPYTVVVPFLVPADAVGPFGVEFTPRDELPRFLRLDVVP